MKKLFFTYLALLFVFSFFGDRSLIKSFRLWREKSNLSRQIDQLKKENETLKKEIVLFKSDPKTIEQYARKELKLAGEHEIQYLFE